MAHNSWELAVDVHAPIKIEEYYQQKKGAIRTIDIKANVEEGEQYPTTPLILPLQCPKKLFKCFEGFHCFTHISRTKTVYDMYLGLLESP